VYPLGHRAKRWLYPYPATAKRGARSLARETGKTHVVCRPGGKVVLFVRPGHPLRRGR